MSQSYAVSVVINTYNYENYVGQAIESVLEQDFPASEREIIVIDDGSTDDTADRVTQYRSRDHLPAEAERRSGFSIQRRCSSCTRRDHLPARRR